MVSSKKERIMVLGAGIMQGPAIRIAKEMGLEVIVADGNPDAEFANSADRFLHIDLKDKEQIADAAARIKAENSGCGLSGIFTAGTDFSATVAYASEKTGLPGIPYEAALNASDKERMRTCFKKAGVRSPKFMVIDKKDLHKERDIQSRFLKSGLTFPLVVKPVDNMGGRGCRKITNKCEPDLALEDAVKFSRSGRVIVEEYMDGPEYSIDAIVFKGKITICGLAERHIFFPPYFIEMGHTMPALLSPEQRHELTDMFENGVRSLGITMGAAKGDVKLTKNGAAIGEIAARLSGGYMSGWTFPYSSGVEVTKAAMLIALGKEPGNVTPLFNKTSEERAFISIPGIINEVRKCNENADKSEYVKDIFLRVRQGSVVDFPQNNVSKCGNVITCAERREDALGAAECVVKSVLFKLECPNIESEKFLFEVNASERGFPPDAFHPGADIKKAASKLPQTRVVNGGEVVLSSFKAFMEGGASDWAGRSVEESLEAVRLLSGFDLPVCKECEWPKDITVLGAEFWQAMIRGGYQGALYVLQKFLKV